MSCPQFHFFIVWYYLVILYHMSTMSYSHVTDENVLKLKEFGHLYLTIWNWVLHLLYFSMACFAHIFQKMPLDVPPGIKQLTRRMSDYLFSAIVFPMSVYVSSTFWIMYAYNRELLYPEVLDTVSPTWFNHIMHTSILPIALLELLLNHHEHPSRRAAFLSISAILTSYGLAMTHAYFNHNVALYPLYPMLNWTEKGLFLAVSIAECSAFYLLGEKLNSLRWGNHSKKIYSDKDF